MGCGAALTLLTLLAVLLGASLSAAKKVGFFTNFLQKSGSSQYDGEFALRWLEDASALAGRPGVFLQPGQSAVYYCCNAAQIQSDGSLEPIIHPDEASGRT